MQDQKEDMGDECQSVSNFLRLISLSIITIASFILLTGIQPAYATLYDRGNGLIYDDDLNITWLQDANYAKTSGYDDDGTMTWYDSMSWAQNLVYGGYDDWRLPTAMNQDGNGPCEGINCTGSEMGHLFYTELGHVANGGYGGNLGIFTNEPPFNPSLSYGFWSGTRFTVYSATAWMFEFSRGHQDFWSFQNNAYALAVRDGDVSQPSSSVPEPSAFLLLGSGLVGFAFLRKRLKP